MSQLARRGLLATEVIVLCAILFIAGVFTGFFAGRRVSVPVAPPKAVIGTMKLYGYVLSSEDRELYLSSIQYASVNDSIVGLVVRVDSPGGYASMVEDIYYGLRRLSGRKPVAAVVEGLAASGGYYATLGANHTFAEATAFIGNIGVVTSTPEMIVPSESTLESGPYKHTGFPVHDFPLVVREGLENFLAAVKTSRSTKLNVTVEELSQGKLYLGSTAVEFGLLDEQGSLLDALSWVAGKAGVTAYDLVEITEEVRTSAAGALGSTLWTNSSRVPITLLRTLHREPLGAYYLSPYYIEGYRGLDSQSGTLAFSESWQEEAEGSEMPRDLANAVLVDQMHGNTFGIELLGGFFGHVIETGHTVAIAKPGMNLTELLASMPKALIVIAPTAEYDAGEVGAVKQYVSEGGRVLLIYEPSTVWAKHINSLGQVFGFYFSDGYLYDLKANYGIYRNIVVRDFANHPLVSNLKELTLLTASNIYSNGTPLATTEGSTYLSLTEARGVYTPIAMSGNVTAIADLTFLLDPFSGLSDNGSFARNLAENVAG